jgi:hypothetical protein
VEFIRSPHAATELTIARDNEKLADRLSAGKFPLGIGARSIDDAIQQGSPLRQFFPGSLKDGLSVTTDNGTLRYINRAPYPKAAKVAANWLRSREGQTAWLDANVRTGGLQDCRARGHCQRQGRRTRPARQGCNVPLAQSRMDQRSRRRARYYRESVGEGGQDEASSGIPSLD